MMGTYLGILSVVLEIHIKILHWPIPNADALSHRANINVSNTCAFPWHDELKYMCDKGLSDNE